MAHDVVTLTHPYLIDFMEKVEGSISLAIQHGSAEVETERSYRILLHIFNEVKIDKFMAMDFAFCRWHEITEEADNIVNVSHNILAATRKLVTEGRCNQFRRIFLVTRKQIDTVEGQKTLGKILDAEGELKKTLPTHQCVDLETRVFIWMDPKNVNGTNVEKEGYSKLVSEIHSAYDFAIFSGNNPIAILEKGLRRPLEDECQTIKSTHCNFTTESEEIERLTKLFEKVWLKSAKIESVISNTCNQK